MGLGSLLADEGLTLGVGAAFNPPLWGSELLCKEFLEIIKA